MPEINYLTQSEAAELLRISPRTLERMRLDGSGPQFRKFGRRVAYSTEDIRNWANARTFTSTSEVDAA